MELVWGVVVSVCDCQTMCPVVSRLLYVAQDAVWFHAKLIGVFIALISIDYCSLSLIGNAQKAPYFAWFFLHHRSHFKYGRQSETCQSLL
jgi:hypothetical protein